VQSAAPCIQKKPTLATVIIYSKQIKWIISCVHTGTGIVYVPTTELENLLTLRHRVG
jgi:hypothetical protein